VKWKKQDEVHCIVTNYHVFREMKEHGDGMVAVFHHENTEKESFELSLVPVMLLAHSKEEVCTTSILVYYHLSVARVLGHADSTLTSWVTSLPQGIPPPLFVSNRQNMSSRSV
jgi:hypothetical protein